jgi:hypothetical protein
MAGDDKPANGGNGAKPAAAKDREGAAGRVSRHSRCANRAGASTPTVKSVAFKGRINNLSGHVYNYSNNRQSNQYTKTNTKEILQYVARLLTAGRDNVRKAINSLALPVITKPVRPARTVLDKLDKIEWAGNMRAYQMRIYNLKEGMKKLFNIVYRQCSDIMIQKLTAMNDERI